MRGYFGIGIISGKCEANVGTLWRSATILGAQFIFTIGKRYPRQASDTLKSHLHIPLFEYRTFEEFKENIPYGCQLIAIELDERSKPLNGFTHPERAVYLLGAEDHGIPKRILEECNRIIQLPGKFCMNVAVAGSIVIYDRHVKMQPKSRIGLLELETSVATGDSQKR